MGCRKTPSAKVTLQDIANLAGVSRITVSHVLNPRAGSVRVSEATRERIVAIAAQLDYHPNLIARQLTSGHSGVVGYIIDSESHANWISCMASAERVLSAAGYRLQVGLLHERYDLLENHLNDFYSRGVDGVICSSHTYLDFGDKVSELFSGFPNCVLIQEPIVRGKTSFVAQDHDSGIRLLCDYLFKHGRTRPLLVNFQVMDFTQHLRIDAFCRCLAEYGVENPEQFVVLDDFDEYGNGRAEYVKSMLERRPDALIAFSDFTALWLIKELKHQHWCVPKDIAVVSYRRDHHGSVSDPSITGLDFHFDTIGTQAAELLLQLMALPEEATRQLVERFVKPDLLEGESV